MLPLTLTVYLQPGGSGWAHSGVEQVQEQHGRRPRLLRKNGPTVQHPARTSVRLAPAAPPSVSLPWPSPNVHSGFGLLSRTSNCCSPNGREPVTSGSGTASGSLVGRNRMLEGCSGTMAGLSTTLAGSARPAMHSGEMLGHV